MPVLENILLSLLSFVIFPITIFNFVIVNTQLIPAIKPFVVTSGSMEPSIAVGSIIYTVKQKEYRVGDVITFKERDGNISHRIVGVEVIDGEKYYMTKGDANRESDGNLVEEKNVYGRVTSRIPFVGNAILFLRNMSA